VTAAGPPAQSADAASSGCGPRRRLVDEVCKGHALVCTRSSLVACISTPQLQRRVGLGRGELSLLAVWSSCDGAAGEELRARLWCFRSRGVCVGCDPRQISCSSGDTMGSGACRDESSMLPTRSASGSLFMAGVDGGGQVLEVAGLGAMAGVSTAFTVGVALPVVDSIPRAVVEFSFPPPRSSSTSTAGTPSMNWNFLSFVRVYEDGIIGGPVTTAGLWWERLGCVDAIGLCAVELSDT
jgi:hypothetical protein